MHCSSDIIGVCSGLAVSCWTAKLGCRDFSAQDKNRVDISAWTKARSDNCAQAKRAKRQLRARQVFSLQRCLTVLKCNLRKVRINLHFDLDTGHKINGL